jgi:hypothetical protein
MKKKFLISTFLFLLTIAFNKTIAQPPFSTNVEAFCPGIITSNDPTTFSKIQYNGKGIRYLWDDRINGWALLNAYLFDIVWNDGDTTQVQIDPEFTMIEAWKEATKYGCMTGQLPKCVRIGLDKLWIHKGNKDFRTLTIGTGNVVDYHAVVIYTGSAAVLEASGHLEEALIHEAAHTSLDRSASGWTAAKAADNKYISNYATTSNGEDLAESFVAWLAARQCTLRINQLYFQIINQTIPNRIAYFDGLNFDTSPVCTEIPASNKQEEDQNVSINPKLPSLQTNIYPNPFSSQATLQVDHALHNATLIVNNSFGRTVKRIENISGSTVMLWRENLASGVYFVQLIEGNKIISTNRIVVTD